MSVEEIRDRVLNNQSTLRLLDQAREQREAQMLMTQGFAAADLPSVDLLGRHREYPAWPSGVPALDDTRGGLCGLTVVGGRPGAGKSTLALGSALEAAEQNIAVSYFDAENSPALVQKRIRRWYGEHNWTRFAEQVHGSSFWWHPVNPGNTFDQITAASRRALTSTHRGLLLVFDSMNSICDRIGNPKTDEFTALRWLFQWADSLVRGSDGFIRILALSELTRAGGVRGHRAEYAASMVLAVEPDEDIPERVHLGLTKNRDGAAGSLGWFERDWRTSRFRPWVTDEQMEAFC